MFLEKGNQQQIEGIVYTLPISVTCTFGHGVKRVLVLEKVQGDSFYFEKFYNQVANYDCLIKSVGKIKFHKKNEELSYFFYGGFWASSVFFSFVTLVAYKSEPALSIFIIPFTTLNFVVVNAIGKKLPKSYIIQNWKLHVL
ncbi:MAG: hypothetical protein ACOYMA_13170 [Bacteroidia bacterium]